jgi:hypothetical protein
MSLVNNWRLLFTTVFGANDLPLLEDRTFYSDPDRIYELQEVDLMGHFIGSDARADTADRRDPSAVSQ